MDKVQGGEGAASRKPPPAQVTGHRTKQAYHKWAQEARAEEEEAEAQAAARGAASSSRPQRVLATRTEATIVFDWHNVLDKAWVENKQATWSTARGTHGYFKPAFTDALKAFVVEHRPVCIAILSYCSRASARWYEVHFLQEAVDCLHRLLPSSTRVRYGQTFQRTGPEGKAQQLSQIDPPASVVIDDNKSICKECRKTGALVAQADKLTRGETSTKFSLSSTRHRDSLRRSGVTISPRRGSLKRASFFTKRSALGCCLRRTGQRHNPFPGARAPPPWAKASSQRTRAAP